MKMLVFGPMLLGAVSCCAAPSDFTVLNQVPALRAAAYERYEKGTNGSPQERGEAAQTYIKDLTAIASKLRDTYYKRDPVETGYHERQQVSANLPNDIENWALLLENVGYPRNVAAGSGLFYDREVFVRRVQLTEQIILKMSKAIVRESWDWEAKGSPPTPFDYKTWLAAWYSSGEELPFREVGGEEDDIDSVKEELRLQRVSDTALRHRVATLPQDILRAHGLHRIEPDDTLPRIARQHGVSLTDLVRWNAITDPAKLRVGDILAVAKPAEDAGHNEGQASPRSGGPP